MNDYNNNADIYYTHTLTTPYPISTNRYYRTFRNITTISEEGRIFKQKVRQAHLYLEPTADEVTLNITIHPKQKKDGTTYKQSIDLDNGLKCVLDSLIGLVYFDDRQVKKLHVDYGSSKANGSTTVLVTKFIR